MIYIYVAAAWLFCVLLGCPSRLPLDATSSQLVIVSAHRLAPEACG